MWQQSHGLSLATVEVFDRSGHQPFFDEADLFVERVTAWLKSLASAST
jgi:pimeloyl-ACP methyl ester carboxylesterase